VRAGDRLGLGREGAILVVRRAVAGDHRVHVLLAAQTRHVDAADDGASVRDLGSTHGTYLDGRRIDSEERVQAGVLVRLGSHGPHFEIVNAIVHGRPVLGPPDATIARAPAAPSAPAAPAPPTASAPGRNRFLAGFAWGVAAGLAVGVAALALFDVRF
jgi:hypothetical protein